MHHTSTSELSIPDGSRVLVGRSLRDLPVEWPRSDRRGEARCFIFQCADVLDVWCDTIGRARKVDPVFVAVLDGSGRPEALLPLGIEQTGGIRLLRFLDGSVSDYNAPVLFPSAAGRNAAQTAALWSALTRHLPPFDLALLEKMPAAVEDLPNPLASLATATRAESCHLATLEGPWEAFARQRIFNVADSRRRRRKLEKRGTVRFVIAATEAERSRILDAMMRMKRRKYVATKGYDVFTDPGIGEYYQEATRRLGSSGPVHLAALFLDDRILAAHWGYLANGRFYHLMPSHEDGEWEHYSPGRLLNEYLMEWCLERGIRLFDFGIGDEPYKFGYCNIHVPLCDAYLPATLKGRLHANVMRATNAAKASLRDTAVGAVLLSARNRLRSR